MLLHILILIAIINSLTGKAIIARNVSDCTISEDGILLYHGKHSLTKFDQECLPWNDLQTMYVDIINEPNFYSDPSIKAAKNYCRNPNMNVDGPWCFVESENIITMEHCNVCQSLASRSTLPTDIGSIDEEATNDTDDGFFPTIRDEVKRCAAYIRQQMKKLMERIRKNIRRLRSRFSDQSNYNT
ncbi:unnamed protein product [Rotaria magnacalcarata]|uniref:Kringle domain-containing protein n=1 Tax=Rotaria magnacalcarata TaxID=392030 RepID=A0A816RC70_9BILA|nr:unnamed protein product [Rotaria magnacalcarata]CAF1683118.1 unnamed protein product [Rotaria magnacalcarata]CAF2070896.1 unnamed protein product [Rotaria magnacalcarata]CAF4016484.1 unnamed protein product [Rotaria magnacalcarata]CAF4428775.1 unnamed protein product [Rotaria magnacalcarata]